MEPDEYSLQRGEQSAKFGMTLIAFSNLALLIPAISTLRYNEQAYIILGGLGTVGFVMFFAGISKYDYKEPGRSGFYSSIPAYSYSTHP